MPSTDDNLTPKQDTRRRVHFSGEVLTAEAPDYDRTACETDIFSCDNCGVQIPGGMKGFEPYGTCVICTDGFDACGACCGTKEIMKICHAIPFSPDTKPTIRSKCHKHPLKVVDRKAEIMWANSNEVGEKIRIPSWGKRLRRNRSASPRKRAKQVSPL